MEAWADRLVPHNENDKIKGYMGTVGVLGGYTENTGAPFFAAMGALRVCCCIINITKNLTLIICL